MIEVSRLILASGSPRRRQLLSSLGVRFEVAAPDIDETPRAGEQPLAYVERLALEKAGAVAADPADVVLAADTTVAVGRRILGKPVDGAEARDMLLALSGRTHEVHTAVAVRWQGRQRSAVDTTRVTMVTIGARDLDWYVATGEPLDRAGAYAMQGGAGLFVRSIEGSASNVVGLPLVLAAELLEAVGCPLAALRTIG
jgi:septum formation protein